MSFFSSESSPGFFTKIRSKLSARRAVSVGAASAVLAAGLVAVPAQAAPLTDPAGMQCAPVHVVYAKGTGNSSVDGSTSIQNANEGADLYNSVGNAIGFDNVSGYSVPYPASLGAVSVIIQAVTSETGGYVGGGTAAIPYGESVDTGVRVGLEHITEYAAKCQASHNTKYIIGGFSQGADVAGDIAAAIGHGQAVDGAGNRLVGPDDVAGVVLFADPGREGLSEFDSYSGEPQSVLYTDAPSGVMGRNLETVVGYAPEGDPTYLGLAGARDLDFRGLQGKVLSLCHPQDPACAVPPHGVLRAIADFADEGLTGSALAATDTYNKLMSFMAAFNQAGGAQAFAAGNIDAGMQAIGQAAATANFDIGDLSVLLTAGGEAVGVLNVAYEGFAGELTFEQFLTVVALGLLPSAAESAATSANIVNGISDLLNVATATGLVPPDVVLQVRAGLEAARLALSLLPDSAKSQIDQVLGDLARMVTEALVDAIAKSTGVSEIMDGPAFAGLMTEVGILGGFGYHGSYWDGRSTMPNGQRTADYAYWWAAQAALGVMNDAARPYVAGANPTSTVEPGIEEVIQPQQPAPAPDPTDEPTTDPTTDPTGDPTAEPTSEPTAEPTTDPIVEPTTEPTGDPTVEPTTERTADPTVDPTVEPTAEPTTDPTQEEPLVALPRIAVDVNGVVTAEIPATDGSATVVDVSALAAQLDGAVSSIQIPEGWTAELDLDSNLLYVTAPEGEGLNGRILFAATAPESGTVSTAELLLVQNEDISEIAGPVPGRDLLGDNILVAEEVSGVSATPTAVEPIADDEPSAGQAANVATGGGASGNGTAELSFTGSSAALLAGVAALLMLAGVVAVRASRTRAEAN